MRKTAGGWAGQGKARPGRGVRRPSQPHPGRPSEFGYCLGRYRSSFLRKAK